MNSLLFAIPGIGNVLLVCMVFWLIFSIVGVQFFGGKFFRCVDIHGERLPISIVPNKTECHRLRYRWVNANINFDHVLNGLIALFQVVSWYLLPNSHNAISKNCFVCRHQADPIILKQHENFLFIACSLSLVFKFNVLYTPCLFGVMAARYKIRAAARLA